jgi:hypothetical protein
MLGVIDMAARPILAMLKDGTIVAVQMPTVSTAHARLLAIDGMLLMLDAMGFARCHAAVPQAIIDSMLLVRMALINRLCLRSTSGAPDPDCGSNDAVHCLHVTLLAKRKTRHCPMNGGERLLQYPFMPLRLRPLRPSSITHPISTGAK